MTMVVESTKLQHCKTCTCRRLPRNVHHIIIYGRSPHLYGVCDACKQVKWQTERFENNSGSGVRAQHCGCCIHPHDLRPGGYFIRKPK